MHCHPYADSMSLFGQSSTHTDILPVLTGLSECSKEQHETTALVEETRDVFGAPPLFEKGSFQQDGVVNTLVMDDRTKRKAGKDTTEGCTSLQR